ncbi:hypothetical protein Golob_027867, partial [Gossypium lobatum]|nr:hypothetical protein [Gossypium lobatum]
MAIMRCIDVQPSNEMTVDEFKAWLRRFDADHDGRINQEELKEALHSLRVRFGWWKARQGMKEADCNHDGQIENAKEIEKLNQLRDLRISQPNASILAEEKSLESQLNNALEEEWYWLQRSR